ncbi:hypothetical protein F4779DRAFT_254370 [Xylariaceae sp. FL0662B]|nr:hypothetical protein F4779DRAFT_254370 [Xylariaceae sp. FL0662B]
MQVRKYRSGTFLMGIIHVFGYTLSYGLTNRPVSRTPPDIPGPNPSDVSSEPSWRTDHNRLRAPVQLLQIQQDYKNLYIPTGDIVCVSNRDPLRPSDVVIPSYRRVQWLRPPSKPNG